MPPNHTSITLQQQNETGRRSSDVTGCGRRNGRRSTSGYNLNETLQRGVKNGVVIEVKLTAYRDNFKPNITKKKSI